MLQRRDAAPLPNYFGQTCSLWSHSHTSNVIYHDRHNVTSYHFAATSVTITVGSDSTSSRTTECSQPPATTTILGWRNNYHIVEARETRRNWRAPRMRLVVWLPVTRHRPVLSPAARWRYRAARSTTWCHIIDRRANYRLKSRFVVSEIMIFITPTASRHRCRGRLSLIDLPCETFIAARKSRNAYAINNLTYLSTYCVQSCKVSKYFYIRYYST